MESELGGGHNETNATLSEEFVAPRKILELVADLQTAGFEDRGGKGSHRNFVHPNVAKPVTI